MLRICIAESLRINVLGSLENEFRKEISASKSHRDKPMRSGHVKLKLAS